MTSNTIMVDREDLYDESMGEPIAYSKANPPYGKTPLPPHHAPTPSTQAEPVVRMVWVPARTPGKVQPQESGEQS
ncbi:MAG: hypothetical protein M3441_10445 [Chloroflexota bacterium]|nr:hypothetical protein [Chloroflexota bacterium]